MISQSIPGLIVGFREGMEAFLIIGIMLGYLDKIQKPKLKKNVTAGMYAGLLGSVIFGLVLWVITALAGKAGGAVSKLWESGASFLALIFISTFIYWMMRHGKTIVGDIQAEVGRKLSSSGLFALATVMVMREGAEIALFAFTAVDKQLYIIGIIIGIIIAAVLAFLVNRSLVKVNLAVIFNVTLGYLILQAAYMLGYSIHEFLSALKSFGSLNPESPLLIKLFNLSGTILDHKAGILGIPLNILVGWYSKPEIVQFIVQHSYILGGFILWSKFNRKS
ncbi:MAG: hydrogenase [Spirochaetes bacterium]|nr:MAG: hydrogenase [Spirochaetota bacterium]RKX92156.1 MAG: hydrogenase [Spirochaetota bacterium]